LVLDSEGLTKSFLRDRRALVWLAKARADDYRVVTSAATLVEVIHPKLDRSAFEWFLSRLVVEPVTERIARQAADLLSSAGLSGHRHAIDAMVCATALDGQPPVTILLSDPRDMRALCGPTVTIITV
jgi:predicted nucleic acid-binding protein